jgi:hypothetical protein
VSTGVLLLALVPGVASAHTAPIHQTTDLSGTTDLCGVPVAYDYSDRFTLVFNDQTNAVVVTDHNTATFTGPNGKALVDQADTLQRITNVPNPDGSQSYTWTLPGHILIKPAHGGVLEFQEGVLKYAATVYADGTYIFSVTHDSGPRLDPDFCGPIIEALTS